MSLEEDFDWISATQECTTEKVFEKIVKRVKEDAVKIQKIKPDLGLYFRHEGSVQFFISSSPGYWRLYFEADKKNKSIRSGTYSDTSREPEKIHAEVAVDLNEKGECVLACKETGKYLTIWQFARESLKHLF